MNDNEIKFNALADKLAASSPDINRGKMMSSPGILYKNKVFAFYHNDGMIFKLGKDYDPEAAGLTDWSYLSPFKNKAPMLAWIVQPASQHARWENLANQALAYLKTELD